MVRPPALSRARRWLRWRPGLAGRYTSRLHDERVAAWLGIWLGISFTVAFVTGLISHFMQRPPGWAAWPSRPVGFYGFTQGLHVVSGLATVPLLVAKLWAVHPKLWQRPAVRSAGHAVSRALIFPLVAGAVFQLVTGILNISQWYPFPFFFTTAHYGTAYIVFGALLIHVANEWATVRRATREPGGLGAAPGAGGLSRRGLFAAVAAASGAVALTNAGQAYPPLAPLAVLAPRRPGTGPQGLPVNKTALAAGVVATARDPAYRLTVVGAPGGDRSWSLAELARLPRRTSRLPITCVEGWTSDATWSGIPPGRLLELAGAPPDATVRVESLQRSGLYRASILAPPHLTDPLTLLALTLNGTPLDLDHGFPCRLIAPNRPGVLQTKWVTRLVVL